MRSSLYSCLIITSFALTTIQAQNRPDPLNIFGYFQVSFMQFSEQDFKTNYPDMVSNDWLPKQNSFSIQHLNLFLSKNISDHWRAFINFEFTNSFSSFKNWGTFNLEEVWIRYKLKDEFSTQAGLLIPTFNNLNEIKNRTPLLPYIFRPFVYETSLKEFLYFFEDFVPSRAWLQLSGTLKKNDYKFDYAFYIGNSPNLSEGGNNSPSGYDTTNTFLLGGRVGIRWMDLKAGISFTHDKKNGREQDYIYTFSFEGMPRYRLGGDFSFQLGKFAFETEFIQVMFDESYLKVSENGEPVTDLKKNFSYDSRFFYGMILFQATPIFDLYAYYSIGRIQFPFLASASPVVLNEAYGDLMIPSFGVTWHINDSVILKAQYLAFNIDESAQLLYQPDLKVEQRRNILMLAGSVFF